MFMQTNSIATHLIPLSLYSLSSSSPQLPHFWENLPLLSKSRSSYWRPGPAKTHQGFPHTCSSLSHHHHHHNHHHHHSTWSWRPTSRGSHSQVPQPTCFCDAIHGSWGTWLGFPRSSSLLRTKRVKIFWKTKKKIHLFQSAFFGNFLFSGRLQLSVDSRMDENWFLSQLRITERERAVEY